jgi:glutamine amidotransferase PdxT
MCPACMATTAMLIASAVSTGGVAAVLVNKLRVKEIARNRFGRQQTEKTWEQHTSK